MCSSDLAIVAVAVVIAAAAAALLSASACEGAAAADRIVSPVEVIWLCRWERVAGGVLGLRRGSARWAGLWGMREEEEAGRAVTIYHRRAKLRAANRSLPRSPPRTR